MSEEIKHLQSEHKGAFIFEVDGKTLAEMTYTGSDTSIIIDHTQVDDSLRGKGVGAKLVAEGVNWARTQQLKIIPLCPFAKSQFDKHPEYNDIRSGV